MQKFLVCAKISGGVGVLCRNYWSSVGAVQNFQVVLGCCAKISGGGGWCVWWVWVVLCKILWR